MSAFSAEWLTLREPADRAARSVPLTAEIARRLARAWPQVSVREPLRVVDLATGTGANPRYLAEHLPRFQEWTVVDADPQLLAALRTRTSAWATRAGWVTVQSRSGLVVACESGEWHLRPQRADLSTFPLAALSTSPALVTGSALLDLVSEPWLQHLVDACRDVQASVLFALTYDGRTSISPADPTDGFVLDLVNRHQLTDKGFGRALGPHATSTAATMFEAAGYLVLRARSDWQLGSAERLLQDELIGGWANAACEIAPGDASRIREWERERRRAAGEGALAITVGHEDLVAWPRE